MISKPLQTFLDRVKDVRTPAKGEADALLFEVNSVVSAAATFYEKIRYLVEYREEHTVRRSAIERMLRRRVFIEGGSVYANDLLRELVEGQYVTADHAHVASREQIDAIIKRFAGLWNVLGHDRKLGGVLISYIASEIDAMFDPWQHAVDNNIVEALYQTVRDHIVAPEVESDLLSAQLLCACRRVVLNADDATLSYALWQYYVPKWHSGTVDIEQLASNMPTIVAAIERDIKHDLQWQIAYKIKNESIYFRIIRELFHAKGADAEHILRDPVLLGAFTRTFLTEKYEKENERIRSSGVRAVLYLLVTKTCVAFAVEVPYEMYMYSSLTIVPLAINVLFHPFLLFALTRNVGSLGDRNTDAVIAGLRSVVYESKTREIHISQKYSGFGSLFAILYLVIIAGVFGSIITLLQTLNFNAVSSALFIFFLALVTYLAFRVRRNAKRWQVSGTAGGFTFFIHILVAPIMRVGHWLSRTYSSINIFVLFMDFIIEMPFKMVLNFSHHFLMYLRDKADEMY